MTNDSFIYWATHTPDGVALFALLGVIVAVLIDAFFNVLWVLW